MSSKEIFIEYTDGTEEHFYNVTFYGYWEDTLHVTCGEEDTESKHTRRKLLIRKMDVTPVDYTEKFTNDYYDSLCEEVYTEADLVSFGGYLLSTKRISNIVSNHPDDPFEAIRQVYHADIENWKGTLKDDGCECGDGEECSSCHTDVINAIDPVDNRFNESDMKDFALYFISNTGGADDLFNAWKQGEYGANPTHRTRIQEEKR